tara:strand:- start:309 stop:494 length:186 start_codon:yes stop_codon:yes gene_type:complete
VQVLKVNKNKMIELIFIIGIVLIVSIGIYLMKSTQDFIDYKNKQIRKQILLNESFNKHKLK